MPDSCDLPGEYPSVSRNRTLHPEMNYPAASAENDEKRIDVLYADCPYAWDGRESDVFISGDSDGLIVDNIAGTPASVCWFDCFGSLLGSMKMEAGAIARVPAPCGGMVRISAEE